MISNVSFAKPNQLGHDGQANYLPCGNGRPRTEFRCGMLSSLNAFGGLSAADILKLFGANSPSSSLSSTTSTAAPTTSTGVDASGANNPANAIQAILAKAEISHAQLETMPANSSSIVTAQTAYAGDAFGFSSVTSTSIVTTSTGADSDEDSIELNGSSLVVATANGLSSVSTGNSNYAVSYLSDEALGGQQIWSQEVREQQAESSTPAAATSSSSAPALPQTAGVIGTPQTAGSDLVLTVVVSDPIVSLPNPDIFANVASQAQQLVSSFENNTLSPASPNATGFGYLEIEGASSVYITATEVPDFGSVPTAIGSSASRVADVQDLGSAVGAMQWNGMSGGWVAGAVSQFIMPVGNS